MKHPIENVGSHNTKFWGFWVSWVLILLKPYGSFILLVLPGIVASFKFYIFFFWKNIEPLKKFIQLFLVVESGKHCCCKECV